ncbi:dihydrofolate reductase family protein [Streptomyces sp. FXJ1.172]|uniref:dihydrofolate reductase family protein n=1 Tax=Streptomyces sp. FXJ1.172 TaxID=710705 RepID=UPI0007CFF49D|nr:dihydrofolate reductase family protein [Streptomyces sp. FXJ1.172]WEO97600.1 dihydrofolate reductase family protein [Streptomyces sp. FXJ1.172]
MRRLTYYIGCSLDGFIAGPDGETDSSGFDGDLKDAILSEYPETIPTHAREALGLTGVPNKVFDTILMGRATYEPALRIGVTSPYAHLRQYVFSSTLSPTDPEVEVVSGDPVEFVRGLKRQPGAGIWLCGGAGLAGQLLGEIDELVVKRYPVVHGSGIPLFRAPFAPADWQLCDSRVFLTGTTLTSYVRHQAH